MKAQAETYDVKMLNNGAEGPNIFEPSYLKIQPGDSVRFLPTQRGHNAASIKEMSPDGYKGFLGKIDKEIVVTYDEPGFYGVKCTPHYSMGMVMIIKVGDAKMSDRFRNFQAPGVADRRFKSYIKRINEENVK